MSARPGAAVVLFVSAVAAAASCRPSNNCEWESWSGVCTLKSVTRVRTIERFPRSYVVLEALYTPADVTSEGAPADVRIEHTLEARSEYDLKQHIQAHPKLSCAVRVLDESICGSPEMSVALPPFVAATASRKAVVKGCALLDQRDQGGTAVAEPIQESMAFAEGTAAPAPDVQLAVGRVATAMRNDSTIECLAIAGQSAFGEDFALADQRARSVQSLLVAQGIDAGRVRVFPAVLPTYAGTSAAERVTDPEHRKVLLTIVARTRAPAP